MSQRYIKALKSQAKPENTLLVNQDVGFVPSQVDDSLNMLSLQETKKRRKRPTSGGDTTDGSGSLDARQTHM